MGLDHLSGGILHDASTRASRLRLFEYSLAKRSRWARAGLGPGLKLCRVEKGGEYGASRGYLFQCMWHGAASTGLYPATI